MQVIVQSSSIEVTEALRAFVTEHVSKIKRGGQRISKIRVFLEIASKNKQSAQQAVAKCAIDLPGSTVVVTRTAADMYQAIADVSKRAARQLRKTTERRRDMSRKQGVKHALSLVQEPLTEVSSVYG